MSTTTLYLQTTALMPMQLLSVYDCIQLFALVFLFFFFFGLPYITRARRRRDNERARTLWQEKAESLNKKQTFACPRDKKSPNSDLLFQNRSRLEMNSSMTSGEQKKKALQWRDKASCIKVRKRKVQGVERGKKMKKMLLFTLKNGLGKFPHILPLFR